MGNHGKITSFLVGFGLLALANAVEVGKEYKYTYEAKMMYQASTMESHKPGMAFRSSVRVQKFDDKSYALKIEDLEVASVNDREFDWAHSEKLTYEKNARLSEMVERPFIVTYVARKDGAGSQFEHLDTQALDPIWSSNLKKGLTSLVNLFIPQNDEHTYESVESTIHGDCRVYWNLQHQPHWTNPDAKVINVTRVIDHEKCSRVASKMYGSLKATPCVNCESINTHPLSSTSRASYQFVSPTGDRVNLILEKAHGHSTITHAPHTENGNYVKLVTKQYLKLVDTKDVTEKLEVQGDKQVHQTLNMDFSADKSFKRALDMKKANDFVHEWEVPASSKKTIAHFKKLTALSNDEENQLGMFERKDPATSLHETIKSLYRLDYQQTEEVFDEIVKKAPEDKKVQVQRAFVEVTSAAGHNAGIQIVIDKITSGEIDTRFIPSFLKGVHMGILEHTEVALNTILNFCKSSVFDKFHKERRNCMLTYTALVDESCRMAAYAPEYADPECHGQKLQNEVFDKLVPEYTVAAKEGDEALKTYIHMARNLKTHKAVEFLNHVINDESVEHFTHLDAMGSMMGILPAHVPIIHKAAAEVYLDRTKPSDIRMLAAVAIFKSSPPLSLLQAMVDGLKHEPSDQVKSFVVSMIQQIDETNHPCFKPLFQHIRYVIDKVAHLFPSEFKRKDFLTSHVKISAGYDPKFDYGGHSIHSVIMADSYLPRQVYIGFGDYLANFFFDNFGLTVRQQGMERLTSHMNSPRTVGTAFGRNLWNFFGRRRLARDTAAAASFEQMLDEKLKIQHKKYDPMRLEVQFSAYGHDLNLLSLNESHFAPLMSPEYTKGTILKNLLSTDRDLHHFMNFHDMGFMIPTAFGLPAWLDVQMPGVLSYKRKDSSFDLTKEGVMKLKLNHRLVVDTRLEEHFGFGVSAMNLAIAMGFSKRVGLNLPMNLDVDANLVTGKVQFNKDFMLPRDIIDYHFTPYALQNYYEEPEKNKFLPLYKDEELKEFKTDVLGDFLGVNVKIEGHRLPDEALSEDFTNWLYKYDCRQKLYYWLANPHWHPRKLHLSAQPADTDPTTGRVLTIKHKMTPPEATERPVSSFQEFQEDLPASFVHVWHVSDEFKSSKERRAELEFRYSYTPDRVNHWFQLFYDRTPFSSKEKDHVKMCMISKVKQTTTDWDKLAHDKVQHINDGQKIEVDTQLHYGKNCKSGPEVTAHIVYDHSDQQKEWLKELETGVEKTRVCSLDNPYMKFYKKCTKWLAKGLVLPLACHKLIIHSSQLNKMVMDIKFNEQVHLHENPYLSTLYAIARSTYYPHLRKHYLRPNNTTPGEIHIRSVVREPHGWKRVADIEFKGPRHTSVWKSVPVSMGAHWAPKTATHLGMTNLQSYSRKWFHRYCDIQKNSVATFDNVIYEMPETKCWKVMAKDCSEQHLFILLTKDTDDNKKDVKLVMENDIFEVNHVGDKLMLTISGTQEELVEGQPKVVKNERGTTTHIIMNKGHDLVMIDAPIYGVYVVSIDSAVFVQAAPFYRGKLCGLCGNFNLDRQHEFHTTDGCHHNTPWSFAHNYVVPDDTCTVPEVTDAGKPRCDDHPGHHHHD